MIAVMGLGRSGLAVAKAVVQRGGSAVVLDQKPEVQLAKPELKAEAESAGATVMTGWDGTTLPVGVTQLVVNPAVPMRHPLLAKAREAGIEVIGEIEFAYRIAKAPIVAITGSNGKSTTVVMTYLCLQACGIEARLCGNLYGSGYPETTFTEAALEASESEVLVAEVSSFQLETIENFEPMVAGITKIAADHLDRYEGFAEYAATKNRIFENQTESDFAVVRAFDPDVRVPGHVSGEYRPRGSRGKAEASVAGPRVLTFGASGSHAQIDESEIRILDKAVPLRDLPFTEPHNFQNAAMAALMAFAAIRARAERDPDGYSARLLAEAEREWKAARPRKTYGPNPVKPDFVLPGKILDGLRSFRGLSHRMELVGSRDGIRVINNSMCTNPDAVMNGLQAARDPVHVLIGGINKELDEKDWRPLRAYLANRRHRVYLFGRDAGQINEFLGGGFTDYGTMQRAFAAATAEAVAPDVIMLAPGCASSDQFRDFTDRGNVFKQIAKEWLET
jgi:UDP-N-acetylmuramoylalanine--D-glutamate ligase